MFNCNCVKRTASKMVFNSSSTFCSVKIWSSNANFTMRSMKMVFSAGFSAYASLLFGSVVGFNDDRCFSCSVFFNSNNCAIQNQNEVKLYGKTKLGIQCNFNYSHRPVAYSNNQRWYKMVSQISTSEIETPAVSTVERNGAQLCPKYDELCAKTPSPLRFVIVC